MSLLLGVDVSAWVSFLPRGTSQATHSATSSDPNCRGSSITAWTPQLHPLSSGLPWKPAARVMLGESQKSFPGVGYKCHRASL